MSDDYLLDPQKGDSLPSYWFAYNDFLGIGLSRRKTL